MPFWKFGHKDINVKSISFSQRIDSLGLTSFLCTSTINIKAMLYSLKKQLMKLVIYIFLNNLIFKKKSCFKKISKVNHDQLK